MYKCIIIAVIVILVLLILYKPKKEGYSYNPDMRVCDLAQSKFGISANKCMKDLKVVGNQNPEIPDFTINNMIIDCLNAKNTYREFIDCFNYKLIRSSRDQSQLVANL